MQSGYGVSEIPQFMVDGLCSPFFPVAGAGAASSAADKHHQQQNLHQLHAFQQQQQQQQQYHLFHQYPHHLNLQQQAAPPPAMQPAPAPTHFHPIPITQQLFQQTHQFHLFQQEQQRRLQHHQHHMGLEQHDPTPPPEASASPPRMDSNGAGGGGGGISGFLGPSMSFRLSVNNDNSGGGSRDGLNDDDDGGGILHGDDVDGSESRWPPPPTSREEENSVIKEPFWRPLDLDLDFINRNNKRCKEKRHHEPPQQQPPPPQQQIDMEGSSIKHFKLTKEATTTAAEVEDGTNSGSNYKLFSELEAICKSGTVGGNNNNNNNNQTGSSSALTGENPPTMVPEPTPMNVAAAAAAAPSDGSTGEEASLKKGATTTSNNSNSKKARRKRRRKEQLSSISAFFETLVKQLMDHQENLHRKFLEVLEKRDRERMAMEESWRQQEATKSALEAKAREEEQAVAAAREAAIVAFLEKLTGETIPLPTRSVAPVEEERVVSSNRWPKAEVQALIGVRSGLEGRFQEPGLKGPLWEEVSIGMVALGYRRSAKRCKEKWENINKYFRKTKESSKKRSQHSKTCPYFHQLDQLYSKSTTNSEMLNAIVVASEDRNAFVDPNEPADGRDDRQTMTVVRREEEEEEEEDGEEEEEENGDGEIAPAEQHGRRRREEEGREGRRVTRVSCS